MNQKTIRSLVLKTFNKRKKDYPGFSLRKLSSKVGVSSGYLSKVLSGQKSMTTDLSLKLTEHLQMELLQKSEIHKALGISDAEPKSSIKGSVLNEFELAANETEWILSKWYYVAVLDLMTCEGYQESANWISKKLQISLEQADESLKVIEKVGLAEKNMHGRLQKKYQKIRFPTRISKEVIREFHKQQMKRAIAVLDHPATALTFDLRLMVGLTVASNPSKVQAVKQFLHEALYQASEMLSDGECTELYQMNLQFFPQTKSGT